MISAITSPFIYFIAVIPAMRLQNSPKTTVNQIPLHMKGEQAKQNQSKLLSKKKMHFVLAHYLVTGQSLTP